MNKFEALVAELSKRDERIGILEEKVAALERQLAEQPNIDQIAIEIEKRFVQQISSSWYF